MEVNFHTMGCHFLAEMNNSLTTQEILRHLPINAEVQIWGGEIYFDTGIVASDYNASLDVNVGDVAYWPKGKCVCVFFGKTPQSIDNKPVPASPVVVIGKLKAIPAEISTIRSGQHIKLFLVEQKEKPAAVAVSAVDNAAGERKLSQSEIDDLVKKLLAEREAKKQA